MRVDEAVKARFWANVLMSESGCWLWAGKKNRHGYGIISIGHAGKMLAHRLAFEIEHKSPPTKFVLHRCDNPPCVNPAHLFQGTQSDNVKDMISKGRKKQVIGERCGRSRLTASKVLEIRARYVEGNGPELALEYGVHHKSIYDVVHRKTWRHL